MNDSLDEVRTASTIYDPLTKLQCSPTSDGSGAAARAGLQHNIGLGGACVVTMYRTADA